MQAICHKKTKFAQKIAGWIYHENISRPKNARSCYS